MKMSLVYFVAFAAWMVYFQALDWFFQGFQGLGYFEFFGSVPWLPF